MNRFCVIFIIIIFGLDSKRISISSIAMDSFKAYNYKSPLLLRKLTNYNYHGFTSIFNINSQITLNARESFLLNGSSWWDIFEVIYSFRTTMVIQIGWHPFVHVISAMRSYTKVFTENLKNKNVTLEEIT